MGALIILDTFEKLKILLSKLGLSSFEDGAINWLYQGGRKQHCLLKRTSMTVRRRIIFSIIL